MVKKGEFVKGENCNEYCGLTRQEHNRYCRSFVGTEEYFKIEDRARAKANRSSRYDDRYERYLDGTIRVRRVRNYRSRPTIGRVHKFDKMAEPGASKPAPSWGLDGRSRGEVMRDYWRAHSKRR